MANKELTENEIKHLEMVEAVIERMGQNSFALKGWVMTLIVAICAFSAAGSEYRFALVAIAPIVAFWFLDAFYLHKERKYRELYKQIIARKAEPFNMDVTALKGKRTSFFKCLFSVTEWIFYLVCILAIVAVFIWLMNAQEVPYI